MEEDGGREAAGETAVKGKLNRTNMTHHDALNILSNSLLGPSDADLY